MLQSSLCRRRNVSTVRSSPPQLGPIAFAPRSSKEINILLSMNLRREQLASFVALSQRRPNESGDSNSRIAKEPSGRTTLAPVCACFGGLPGSSHGFSTSRNRYNRTWP